MAPTEEGKEGKKKEKKEEESEEEWMESEEYIRINVGGGIENIWILKNQMIWAECSGKFYFHKGHGQPNEWHEHKPTKESGFMDS